MESRRNGGFKRSLISALAAVMSLAIPSLVSSTALAEKSHDKAADAPAADAKAKPAKRAKKAPKKALAKVKASGHDKSDARPAPEEPQKKKSDAKASAPGKNKKAKKTAAREPSAKKKAPAKKADSDAPRRSCLGAPVAVDRGGLEAQSLTLTDCHDRPIEAAGRALSVLARPWGTPKPALAGKPGAAPKAAIKGAPKAAIKLDKSEIAPGVRVLDKGLATRVAAIAKRFPDRPISLVSGYRPQSRGSLHQHGRALDLRVAGVSNEQLVAFCKTLPDTGCGYYPNSSFVHIDVRNPGTGKVTWIDTSGPGEAPHYVPAWPPKPEESDKAVLPAEAEPHDRSVDPWAIDSADEHASHGDAPAHPVANDAPLWK